METRRHDLLRRLERAATGGAAEPFSETCSAICYQILYGLPQELQLRAACSMSERYLPIFEAKWPGVRWPRQLLEDVDAWHRVHGTSRPYCPDEGDSAEGAFHFSFDFLLCAYKNRNDLVSLAACSTGTIDAVAYARASHVWLADDPAAAHIERERDAYYLIEEDLRPSEPLVRFEQLDAPAHSRWNNVAFMAVLRREWAIVAAWLREKEVWQYPEPEDLDAMMAGLKRWEERQFLPMGTPSEDHDIDPD